LAPNKGNGVGVHVSGIKPSSTAARVGIQVGDLILAINGQRVIDVSHAAVKAIVRTAATSGKQITIKVCGSKGD
jgi:C-terminal processing protease CtpA/Prc